MNQKHFSQPVSSFFYEQKAVNNSGPGNKSAKKQ